MADTGSAQLISIYTKGSANMATQSNAGSAQASTPESQVFQLERAEMSIQQVPWNRIRAEPEKNGFRKGDVDPYSGESLLLLIESIKSFRRVHTPLMLKEENDGWFVVADGHQRYFGLGFLIKDGVQGFTQDMLVPAYVMAAGTSDLVMVSNALSANVEREPLPFEGRLDAVGRLHTLGMPRSSIARLLRVSESTIDRDLTLAKDDEMRTYITRNCITASAAATLLAAAEKNGRRQDLMNCFQLWTVKAGESLQAEEMARKERDQPPLPVAKRFLKNRLSADQVAQWKRALEAGTPLDHVEQAISFPAFVDGEGADARVTIAGFSKPIRDLTSADLAKILKNCLDVASALEPILVEKASSEERSQTTTNASNQASPGLERLRTLGFSSLVGDNQASLDKSGESVDESDSVDGTSATS